MTIGGRPVGEVVEDINGVDRWDREEFERLRSAKKEEKKRRKEDKKRRKEEEKKRKRDGRAPEGEEEEEVRGTISQNRALFLCLR